MKTIQLAEINISLNRQRRTFPLTELNELGESIKRIGLMHPIVLRDEGGEKFLNSGERRLRAITDIYDLGGMILYDNQNVPHGEIPYVDLGELDELGREEAELEENIRRSNLTWQERSAATARIARVKLRRAERDGTPAPTTADVAMEVRGSSEGINQETTRREIIVAEHLGNPEVSAAKDVNEAFKILRRQEDAKKRVLLAAEVGRTYSAETAHQVFNTDAMHWLVEAPADQFDVICTDPIYGIGADEFGDSGGKAAGAHFYDDSYETWRTHVVFLATEGFRITKAQAHLYAFCDITHFAEFKEILTAAGWKCFRTPIVWHKPNGARLPWITSGPQRKFEIILYAKKGDKPVNQIFPDLVTYSADLNLGHQAQKPVSLYIDLLKRSVAPGDKVLDPFAGSGPILPAANALKVHATAVEKDPAAYGICIERLNMLKEEPELEGL